MAEQEDWERSNKKGKRIEICRHSGLKCQHQRDEVSSRV